MESFAPLKFHLRRLGILKWNNSLGSKSNAILTNCIVLGFNILYVLKTSLFVIFKAQTQQETSTATIFAMAGILLALSYVLLIWNKEKIEKLLDDVDVIIKKRENNTFNISDVTAKTSYLMFCLTNLSFQFANQIKLL